MVDNILRDALAGFLVFPVSSITVIAHVLYVEGGVVVVCVGRLAPLIWRGHRRGVFARLLVENVLLDGDGSHVSLRGRLLHQCVLTVNCV